MTTATERCFISYRRSRLPEIKMLAGALLDRGIPVWQDIHNLEHDHTDDAVRRTLLENEIGSGVIWLTPDVAQSDIIRKTEIPILLKRCESDQSFFVVPVAVGGLDYHQIPEVAGDNIGLNHLDQWNVFKIQEDVAKKTRVDEVADHVLCHRIRKINKLLPKGDPIRMSLHTRKKPAFDPKVALSLDWSHRFDGRQIVHQDWNNYLLPALKSLAKALEAEAPGREIHADGFPSLSAALALGTFFSSTRGTRLSWMQQFPPPGGTESWHLWQEKSDSGFQTQLKSSKPSASDLAVLVNITADTTAAVAASNVSKLGFRAILKIDKYGTFPNKLSSGDATHVASMVREGIQKARNEFTDLKKIHLFMAAPVGLAVIVGQSLNSFGPVQTYEHFSDESAVGKYIESVLLKPSQ